MVWTQTNTDAPVKTVLKVHESVEAEPPKSALERTWSSSSWSRSTLQLKSREGLTYGARKHRKSRCLSEPDLVGTDCQAPSVWADQSSQRARDSHSLVYGCYPDIIINRAASFNSQECPRQTIHPKTTWLIYTTQAGLVGYVKQWANQICALERQLQQPWGGQFGEGRDQKQRERM